MKIIVYRILQGKDENGVILTEKCMPWNEANEEIARREAYNGEYYTEDIEMPEAVVEPTADEVLNALLGVM